MDQYTNRVDLHIHSTASDGLFTPSEVVHLALECGLSVIALTDHDTLGGIEEARQAASGTKLEVIPGVEINSEGEWGDIHVLGYYVDPKDNRLGERLQALQEARADRAHRMVERLREMGMPLDWKEIETLAGGDSIGRPHMAHALLNRGYVKTIEEAFRRFVSSDSPAYVPRLKMTPPQVIAAIAEAGGLPVLAHPAHSGPEAVARIPEFVEYGLRGVEAYYYDHSPRDVEMLLELCRKHRLLVTGGSDFHGPGIKEGAALGAVHVPLECIERLREAATGGANRASASPA